MKVSLNWVKSYLDFELPPADAVVERIGAQLGAVETVEAVGDKYKGIIIAKVVSCVDHPNADRLHVCKVDDGGKAANVERDEGGHVQVVCGAPNVREGLLVAWLPPGSTVPESVGKEPFVLEARELRGAMSNGMLASPRELAIGDSHDGILEVDVEVAPGTDFAEAYNLVGDVVIDIENKMFTHRPDCFGFLGIARELAGIHDKPFRSPTWYNPNAEIPAIETDELPLEVHNELPELVPRFMAVTMRDVAVGPSPVWLQIALSKVGLRSINNIVDYTNFFMLETGQPLHAYDYDKLKALGDGNSVTIVVRQPKPGEKLQLLNGKEIEPKKEAIMIATASKLIGLGGVMGGGETEVDSNTKNIILECANFDMYSIRRTSMAHGLFSDAVTRFNKGQSPLQNRAVLAKIVDEIRRFAGGKVASEVIDQNQLSGRQWVHPPVPVAASFINARLGLTLPPEAMKQLLENVEFQVAVEGDGLVVTTPFWRTDVEQREDVVEEVGRLYGFDKLPLELPRRSIKPATKNPLLTLKNVVRENLVKAGANEVLTYSFVHADLLQKSGQDTADAFGLSNALSPDLQYYRLSLTPSLLDKVHSNIKAGYDEFALFEMGKGHNLQHAADDEGLPMEFEMLDLVYAAADKAGNPGAAFYEARKFLVNLGAAFGLQLEFRPFASEEDYPVAKPYDHTRSAQVFVKGTDLSLGMVGEYKPSVRRALKLPAHTAGFGIGLAQLQTACAQAGKSYVPLPRFPKVSQDMTLKVAADLPYQKLYDCVTTELDEVRPEHSLASLEPLDIYQRQDNANQRHISFRLTLASYERTLTDVEVTALMERLVEAAHVSLGAERV